MHLIELIEIANSILFAFKIEENVTIPMAVPLDSVYETTQRENETDVKAEDILKESDSTDADSSKEASDQVMLQLNSTLLMSSGYCDLDTAFN